MADVQLKFPVFLSILAALVTLALKSVAYYFTGSVGLLSDAADSVVNLLAAATALLSLWYSAKPVDPTHTYGREKIEFLSSGLEGVLIFVAAAGIAWYGVRRLLLPQELEQLDVGVAISLIAALINLGTARILLRVGRARRSIVLEAGGRHLMADVWTSVAVLAGLGLVWLTQRHWLAPITGPVVAAHIARWLDPVIGLLVVANITRTAFDLVRRSFNGLMDHALPEEEQAAVRAAVASRLEPGMDFHALRTRQAGSRRFVDFHLLVPGVLTVRRA